MTAKEKRIYAQYQKELKEAQDRWWNEPCGCEFEGCRDCTPRKYWESNNCERCKDE